MTSRFPGEAERIVGTCVRVLWARGVEGAVVVRLKDGRQVVLTGSLGAVLVGDTVTAEARRVYHRRYGWQYEVDRLAVERPEDRPALVRYLSTNVAGIGPKTAEQLVAALGRGVLAPPDADTIQKALAVTPRRAERLARLLAPLAKVGGAQQEVAVFLAGLGLSDRQARALFARFGAEAKRLLEEDPYALVGTAPGLGFPTVDRFALRQGMSENDPRRRQGAVLYALQQAEENGDLFLSPPELEAMLSRWRVPFEEGDLEALARRGSLVLEEQAVYRSGAWQAEEKVARLVAARLAAQDGNRPLISIVTGGPGTGKTTRLRAMVAEALAEGRRVELAAPSGRAARRLSEATGVPASTIHRMLRMGPGGRVPPGLRLEADLVVVDEASMCDIYLLRELLAALRRHTALLLVGDPDQLPPVGPGQPLRDLMATGLVPTVSLTKVYRQGEGSGIAQNAPRLREGRWPMFGPDLVFLPADDAQAVVQELLRVIRGLPGPRENLRAWQVLTPGHRGAVGVAALNAVLQASCNPGAGAFRPGDKVIQVENDYERGVMNGEIGLVERVEGATYYVRFPDLDEEQLHAYPAGRGLALAYAMTVHKAQGSEFDVVIVVLHAEHYPLLRRSVLYTAATRARQRLYFVGQRKALWLALTKAGRERHSRLAQRILTYVEG